MIDGGLRKLFHANVKRCHWTAIESGLTSRGIPDSHFCMPGSQGWVEFKRCKHWRVPMRPEQIGWIERQIRMGGRVFIAVRRAEDELWLLPGSTARTIKIDGLRAVPSHSVLGMWRIGSGAVLPWGEIRRILGSAK